MSLEKVNYQLTKDEVIEALKRSENLKDDFNKFEIKDLNILDTYIENNGNSLGIKAIADYKEINEKDFLTNEKNNIKADIIKTYNKISELYNSKYTNERLIRDLVYMMINLTETDNYLNNGYDRNFYSIMTPYFEELLESLRLLKNKEFNTLDFSCNYALNDYHLLDSAYGRLFIFYTKLRESIDEDKNISKLKNPKNFNVELTKEDKTTYMKLTCYSDLYDTGNNIMKHPKTILAKVNLNDLELVEKDSKWFMQFELLSDKNNGCLIQFNMLDCYDEEEK